MFLFFPSGSLVAVEGTSSLGPRCCFEPFESIDFCSAFFRGEGGGGALANLALLRMEWPEHLCPHDDYVCVMARASKAAQ